MATRETAEEALRRWDSLKIVQDEYKDFYVFMDDVIEGLMGFKCSDIQKDIGSFLVDGPIYSMIQAQRGQAKTTITAIYAVWRLIHQPNFRILIVSSGGTMAKEISGWIIQIINGMDVLTCMRPDRSNGDRSSIEAYDIHYSLKGPEKSPSVACMGITSNIQGKRADLLIADDVESSKNAATDTQRHIILNITRDFTSICSTGKIVYLGTPQSSDSIYNSLASRGYVIRIWPGRYPTETEEANYGFNLAPLIASRMAADPSLRTGGGLTGARGKPIDPLLLDEEVLVAKELDQGPAYFQLQHMLDTKLSDAQRFPLKLSKILFMTIPADRAPVQFDVMSSPLTLIGTPVGLDVADPMYRIAGHGRDFMDFASTHMYVDPAGGGQGADETAYAITKFIGGYIFLVDVGGIPGGIDEDQMNFLTDKAVQWKPNMVHVEKNFGNGMFAQVWRPLIAASAFPTTIEDVWETGQKELRIIDTLEPVIGRRRFIVEEALIAEEWEQCSKYGLAAAKTYSFIFQLSRITRDKKCLAHDDRLDAVAGSVRFWTDLMAQDEKKVVDQAAREALARLMKDPLGNGRKVSGFRQPRAPNAFNRFNRR